MASASSLWKRFAIVSCFVISFLLDAGILLVTAQQDDLDCEPCIDRSSFRIKAIYGPLGEKFWDQIEDPAVQASLDLGVELDVTRLPISSSNPDAVLAAEIRSILTTNPRPAALITSIPSNLVRQAVEEVIAAGIPVFGLNSGYVLAKDLGVLAWVAQDELVAGEQAAAVFLRLVAPSLPANPRLGFVNHNPDNEGFELRLSGFNSFQPMVNQGFVAESILLNPSLPIGSQLDNSLGNCDFDFVLLAGSVTLEDTIATLTENNCDTLIGSFDESAELFQGLERTAANSDNIVGGSVMFGLSQQKYLQGMLPVVFATTYVTTGKVPAIPSRNPNGIFLSNGTPWTINRIPSAERQLCIEDSFPVCPQVGSSGCPCFDRSSIRIGGVLHGDTEDGFWDNVFSGAAVAAKDMGVQLDLQRISPPANNEALVATMNAALTQFCTGDNPVDGLFVSIPNVGVIDAIRVCRQNNIPIIAVNSGAIPAEELDLQHFIGQLEFTAGFEAAQALVEESTSEVTRAWCVNHAPNVDVLQQRCSGFRSGLVSNGVDFAGVVNVTPSNLSASVAAVEAAVGQNGSWAGLGFLLVGQVEGPLGLELLSRHSDASIGIFDTSSVIFDALQSGQYLFAVNQQPYFQGYLPIPLLTVRIQANRQLLNFFIESGPRVRLTAPGIGEQQCEANDFVACDSTSPVPAPTPTPNNQCRGFGSECNSAVDCCSDRCVLNECQKAIPAPKAKLGGDGRGGAANGNRRRLSVRGR